MLNVYHKISHVQYDQVHINGKKTKKPLEMVTKAGVQLRKGKKELEMKDLTIWMSKLIFFQDAYAHVRIIEETNNILKIS